MHSGTIQTIVIVAVFAFGYLFSTVRKTARQQLDLYDLVMLSTVAVIPIAFLLFPSFGYWLADLAGVGFPFVVMFGVLFAILFVFIHRLTVKLHRLEKYNRLLIQEVSLLKQTTEPLGVGGNTISMHHGPDPTNKGVS